MRAAAYAYADGGPMPSDLQLLRYIDRFGGHAVMGRCLGINEMKRMIVSDNIVRWFNERASAKEWADWADKNESESDLLNQAMILAQGMGLINA